jgi:alpha-1,6-mannosyltransferase
MSVHGPLSATPQSGAVDLRHALDARATLSARPLDARRVSSRSSLPLIGLSGVLLAGLVISVSAAHTDVLLPESVRPVPHWLAGAFGSAGLNLHVGGVIAVFAVMFASYAVVVSTAERLSARAVLMAIAALHALMLLAPPLISTDVFSYQAYARMWSLYGANPYLHGPHVIALDPLYPFIGAKWVTTPTAYGPIFTMLSYLLAPLSIAASTLAYKSIAALASLATVALVWNGARLRGLNPAPRAALVGLNPLTVVYGVGGGHNDLLMLAALVAGVYALLQRREKAGGAMMLVASGIKLTAGLCAPFALLSGREPRSRRRELLIGGGAATALMIVLSLAAFGTGPLHLLGTLQSTQSKGDWHSIPGFIATRLGLAATGHIAGICLGVVFVVAFMWLLHRVWRGRLDWIDGTAWATVVLLITASSMLPWYVAWLIPFVALGTDNRLWRAAIITTGVVQAIQLVGYLPHGGPLLAF